MSTGESSCQQENVSCRQGCVLYRSGFTLCTGWGLVDRNFGLVDLVNKALGLVNKPERHFEMACMLLMRRCKGPARGSAGGARVLLIVRQGCG